MTREWTAIVTLYAIGNTKQYVFVETRTGIRACLILRSMGLSRSDKHYHLIMDEIILIQWSEDQLVKYMTASHLTSMMRFILYNFLLTLLMRKF